MESEKERGAAERKDGQQIK